VLNRLTGIVLLGSRDERWKLREEQAELLQALAGQAGLAFENAVLHREQRDRLRRLYRAERLAAAGQLAAGVAHEIRNPLTSIRSTIQYVLPSFGAADQKRILLDELLSEVDRIDRIVNDLLSLTRPTDFHPSELNLVELLDHALLLIGPQARKQAVEIKFTHFEDELKVSGDAGQLKQVFLNIFLNSLQAMPQGGTLGVSARRKSAELSGRELVDVQVTDTGAGIPAEHLDKVFDPFFTLKKEGTGLGLSISYSIIQQHEGDIELHSEVGRGTTVIIRLPGRG
jgi:signal transduction histidine kinase